MLTQSQAERDHEANAGAAAAGGSPSLATAVVTKVTLREGQDQLFAPWQSSFTRAATLSPGFVSLEIIPAVAGSGEWRIIQRFATAEHLERWRISSTRTGLLAQLTPLRAGPEGDALDETAPDFDSLSCVTEVITTEVEAGREEAFQSWAETIQARQATFPGYMGTFVQAPISPDIPYWTTLVRFARPEQLEAWLGSQDRKAVLERSDPRVSRWTSERLRGPFGGWFPAELDQAPAPAWKQTCLVLLVLFPVVMLEIRFLSPLLAHIPLAVATFVGNAISVFVVSWPLMQVAISLLGWWLTPDPGHRWRTEVLGACTLATLYAAEVAFCMLVY